MVFGRKIVLSSTVYYHSLSQNQEDFQIEVNVPQIKDEQWP